MSLLSAWKSFGLERMDGARVEVRFGEGGKERMKNGILAMRMEVASDGCAFLV